MKHGLWLMLAASLLLAQGFQGTYSDHPFSVDSKGSTLHVSTFGGFALVDDYFTDPAYPAVLPPFGIGIGFSTPRIFANLGYAKDRGFELTFHHTIIKSRYFNTVWGINGLIIPDIESEHTFYVPEDSTERIFRVPAFAALYVTPHRILSGGIGVGFGKYGIGRNFESPLYKPGVFLNAKISPVKQLSFFWEGYYRTYRRNIGVIISPWEFIELTAFFRYCQYPPYNELKLRQLFVGLRLNIPVEKKKEEAAPPPPPVVVEQPIEEEKPEEVAPPPPPVEEKVEIKIEEKPEEKLPTEYTVKKGDCLWRISGYSFIYNDPRKWPVIYEANKDKIRNPDLIYPGQLLLIPR